MKYLLLNTLVLCGVIALVAGRWRRLPLWTRWHTVLVLLVLTLGFDNVLVSLGTVDYLSSSGFRLGLAPIEDFAYAVAAAVLLPVLWEHFKSRRPPSS